MIKNNTDFAKVLIALARQTKNYKYWDEETLKNDINAIIESLETNKIGYLNDFLDKIEQTLMENAGDRRSAASFKNVNELRSYLSSKN